MSEEIRSKILFRLVFYMAATAFIVLVWQYQKNLFNNTIVAVTDTSAASLKDKELDALLAMNQLVTTLSTGLLGAIGFLLVNVRRENRGSVALWAACCSAVCAALSLFFGYVVYLAVITMLHNQFFDSTIDSLLWPRQAHFYFFLLAVVLFGDFAFNNLRTGGQDAAKASANRA